MDELRAEFTATLPSIMSAIRYGDGAARVQLDIPSTELAEALKLVAMHGKRLRVTIVAEDGE